MAQLFAPGACLLYTSTGAAGAWEFFGTGQGAPEIDVEPEYEPVLNDFGGTRKGFDFSFQGESGVIKYELNRYDELVYSHCQARPNPTTVRGVSTFGQIGSFMVQEGLAYGIVVRFPYSPLSGLAAAKAGMVNLPAGYYFRAGWMAGDRQRGGTKPKVITAIFQCERVFVPADGSMSLYTTTLPGGLPAIS